MKILAGDDIYLDNNSLDNNEFVDITIGETISTVEIDDLYVAVEAFRKQKQLRKEYDQSKNHMEESEKKAGRIFEINGLIGAAVSQDTSDGAYTFTGKKHSKYYVKIKGKNCGEESWSKTKSIRP